jgi:hypothetical protein
MIVVEATIAPDQRPIVRVRNLSGLPRPTIHAISVRATSIAPTPVPESSHHPKVV